MFDAIVIGSGMSGGISAKELAERGLKVLLLERGRKVEHVTDYNDTQSPWELPNNNAVPEEELARDYPVQRQCYAMNAATKQFWVKDSDHPYITPDERPFTWIRGYHLGGRSIMWGRQSYRLSPMDFEANAKDGHGVDWPIRYDDLAPWYSHIEKFIGVSGSKENLPQLPDGEFLPPWEMNDAEKLFKASVEQNFPGRKVIIGRNANLSVAQPHHEELGRTSCQNRSICERGCSFGANHTSLSSSLPAAERTGNLTIVTDAIVHSLVQDPKTGRITSVRVIDAKTKEGKTYEAKVFFLNASTIGTAQILLNSRSEANPRGLCNKSDQVGRNIMDHMYALSTVGVMPEYPKDSYYRGRRPTGIYIPRYRNVTEDGGDYVRGYGYQGAVIRQGGKPSADVPGIGQDIKQRGREFGPWVAFISGFGEMLPNPENRVVQDETRKDKWGIPLLNISVGFSENERKMAKQILADGKAMIEAAGGTVVSQSTQPGPPGLGIHEMGTARMGRDPMTSVFNGYNQAHEAPNLFCTDGAVMASSGCQNPSLTYMAMSARAAHHAAEWLKAGKL
ncbi:GMC family oxidoreductase [Novosphingobium sp. ERN07]|uniref:GMC oxidoreductase n=1 Tax=Novosphingobium sp. ERN07 TaxID=2726187 RepID=UPI0014565E76|nr:GMC family oxidoreductase [Novosphingobium sp. ERN07]NLR70601.1 GMC family oxidoreductase [Novosphingobium sp. ERN07]